MTIYSLSNSNSQANYNKSFKAPQDCTECPKMHSFTLSNGETRSQKCNKRTCIFVGCRETWASYMSTYLRIADYMNPFNYRWRITPPKELAEPDRVKYLEIVLKEIRLFKRRT